MKNRDDDARRVSLIQLPCALFLPLIYKELEAIFTVFKYPVRLQYPASRSSAHAYIPCGSPTPDDHTTRTPSSDHAFKAGGFCLRTGRERDRGTLRLCVKEFEHCDDARRVSARRRSFHRRHARSSSHVGELVQRSWHGHRLERILGASLYRALIISRIGRSRSTVSLTVLLTRDSCWNYVRYSLYRVG
ncbi:hypothetical protein FA95DRAFT_1046847 [Auriscalpium vulgare]|uniref:Uncharacterized protein n=1 Tax=Auriscalpium vulgare TaxID=40419 RepID=A0ACB8S9Z9_9AGAM|nr:hypothetical protein FA95DRAFT_1046847 [Auriscalpium vulgare]